MALPNIPLKNPLIEDNKLITWEWASWIRILWLRIGEPWKTNTDYIGSTSLVLGTVTVPSQVLNANILIFLNPQTSSVNAGFLSYVIDVANNQFIITSSNPLDDRVINWEFREAISIRG